MEEINQAGISIKSESGSFSEENEAYSRPKRVAAERIESLKEVNLKKKMRNPS